MKVRLFCSFLLLAAFLPPIPAAVHASDSQKSFETAVYIPVADRLKMKDRQWLDSSWAAISSQLQVDKVYIETYRSRVIADDQVVEDVKKFFLGTVSRSPAPSVIPTATTASLCRLSIPRRPTATT